MPGKFHEIETPTTCEMQKLLHRISERMARLLEREGYLERDTEAGSLLLDGFEDDVINHLQGSSITYRIAVGSQRGKKVFTLKTLPARDDEFNDDINGQALAKSNGLFTSCRSGVPNHISVPRLSDCAGILPDLWYPQIEWNVWPMAVSVTN